MPGSRTTSAHSARSKPRNGIRSEANTASASPVPGIQVVGIGASAGGLEACAAFLDALKVPHGMAFILVQHLDPTHESLMVELLTTHTSLTVLQATDGTVLERDHLYIIPPGCFLTVSDNALRLKPAPARRGARLPFDALLLSMAQDCGARATCIVLSGTGADGSIGLLAIKKNGGVVLVQDPGEAGYDGMPLSAIATGVVDRVLPVAAMPEALSTHVLRAPSPSKQPGPVDPQDSLPAIIALLRARTHHDFTLYKPGTLHRRVERRMAMAAIPIAEMPRYVEILRNDPAELERLAKDLLIHVTRFFRDPDVFEQLAQTVVPELIREHRSEPALRVWVAGCSTGEEAYSIAMVFHEAMAAANSAIKLQIFASDADADAVASARDGLYPATIETEVSPARLAAFFVREDQSYRVLPELRAMIVFTVQDLLADPPFSRLDLVSCRNVMIYLGAQAQRKVVALFHFALRTGGFLLLGGSEGVGDAAGRFAVVSKAARIYRHVGRSRPGSRFRHSNPTQEAAMPKTMHAAVVEQFGQPLVLREMPVPSPGPGQILVKTEACGVCHTDLHAANGDWPARPTLPFIPGHEGIGVVCAIGAGVTSVKEGERVGVPWLYSACGHCEHCLSAWETVCAQAEFGGYTKNGGFAEYILADPDYVAHVPANLAAQEAAPIICAGITTYKGIKVTEARPGEWLVVSGAGGLGHLAIQYAKVMGLLVCAVDIDDGKLAHATRLGADMVVNAAAGDAVATVRQGTGGGAHGVLITAPSLGAFRQGVGMTRKRGTCALVGLPPGEFPLPLFDVVANCITVRGSFVGTRQDMAEALAFAADGRVRADIELQPLAAINEVFVRLQHGDVPSRVVLDFA